MSNPLGLSEARTLVEAAEALTQAAVVKMKERTRNGRAIDDHQVATERVAYAATEARAARELLELIANADAGEVLPAVYAVAGAAELAKAVYDRLSPLVDDLELGDAELERCYPAEVRNVMRAGLAESLVREIGREVADRGGRLLPRLDEVHEEVRRTVRQFADKEVAPRAEHIHRSDALVPEDFIQQIGELGYFGLSVPEQYGGHEMGNLAMVLTTEELSRASLAAAGSLITRPEILTKALLAGGTDAQKAHWLPKIASGEVMVAISVTEPNTGSDVASIACKAERATVGGEDGFVINGAKAWCTFAGRANVVALLARTDPEASKKAKGLSLFIVPKDSFTGHEFEMTQPGGGKLTGKADATIGYRGMHSYTLQFENFFVPAENLIGLEQGEGRGFYLQMAGFAAGRLQTGGRACGVAQAALEAASSYVTERTQFGRATVDFQLTQYMLGRMALKLAAARAIAYAAAVAMDEDERKAAPLAGMAKLYSCDVAVEVTQQGQLLHGGWGYAEEYAISRYVVDALVLPLFEGVKPILELKLVGRDLLS